jgi:alginate O-acetyltransferase complex protein AlgI
MIFATYWYVLFVAVFFPLYWAARVAWARLALLLIFCGAFQAHFAGAAGMAPILVLAALTYCAGVIRRKWALAIGMAAPIGALLLYKYSHFFALGVVGSVRPAWGAALNGIATRLLPAAPPLAISFFTFEFVHYLYDVSKGSPSMRNPAKFAAFGFFFPSLVAGPIKRYQPFEVSLRGGLSHVPVDEVKAGLVRVAVGYFKKSVIADNLSSAIDFYQPDFAKLTLLGRWELFVAIAVRILADFSGYSDIAIGFAQMMGIRIPENFNWPYLATNLREFWHRWHISLSLWIRDYVYIPLGGNRHGIVRKVLNALIAFGLVGLWHGADWHFVLWGLYHGAGLAVSSNYRAVAGGPGRALGAVFDRVPVLAWAVTTAFVFAGWLLFFYPAAEAMRMAGLLFSSK